MQCIGTVRRFQHSAVCLMPHKILENGSARAIVEYGEVRLIEIQLAAAFSGNACRRPGRVVGKFDCDARKLGQAGQAIRDKRAQFAAVVFVIAGWQQSELEALAWRNAGDIGSGCFRILRQLNSEDESERHDIQPELRVKASRESFAQRFFCQHIQAVRRTIRMRDSLPFCWLL